MADRLGDTRRFYGFLDRLATRVGGPRLLQDCRAGTGWPSHGVYFFFEDGETRRGTGAGLRVVRVGTHALKDGAKSTLWKRLRAHRGTRAGGGNHRGSVFRKHLGVALATRDNLPLPESWGVAGSGGEPSARVEAEADLEARVSEYVGRMPFLWLHVNDLPGPDSSRGSIERNAIALLSGYSHPASDGPTTEWLGRYADNERIGLSGLWNDRHVDEDYDPSFLDEMESRIDETPI